MHIATLVPGLFPRILQATENWVGPGNEASMCLYMSRFANNTLLGGGVRVRVWIREQRENKKKIKGTTKPILDVVNLYSDKYRPHDVPLRGPRRGQGLAY